MNLVKISRHETKRIIQKFSYISTAEQSIICLL